MQPDCTGLRSCPYRRPTCPENANGPWVVCLAAPSGESEASNPYGMHGTDHCVPCPVPDAFRKEIKTCLYLLPIRLWDGSNVQTFFHCRLLYEFNPKRANTSYTFHSPELCPWWFPHPKTFLPPQTEWHTNRAVGLYRGKIGRIIKPCAPGPNVYPGRESWWKRLLKCLAGT